MNGHRSHRRRRLLLKQRPNNKARKLTGVGVISHCCVLARTPVADARGMANISTRLERCPRTGGFEFVLHRLIFHWIANC